MNYTVQELAKLSHVSVRTLHHYDAIGLLKPAFVGENKYRYYQEKQLLRLQQILFFKELGFDLKQIQSIVESNDFDTHKALQTHAHNLEQRIERLQELLKTIDRTIHYLEGKKSMNTKELYYGFDGEKQKQYEKELDAYFAHQSSDKQKAFARHKKEAHQKVAGWSKKEWEASGQLFDDICKELVAFMEKEANPDDKCVQAVIARHFQWLSNFWQPNKASYKGHADFIINSALQDAYNKYHPELAVFVAEAIKQFADNSL